MNQMNVSLFILFLGILLISSLMDLLIPILLGRKYPGYSHLLDTISELGSNTSPVQKFECLNLIVVGMLLILFSVGQFLGFEAIRWSHKLYLAGIVLFGVGTVLAGFFHEDPKLVKETFSGKIHGISSGIGFIFLILNPFWAIWIAEFSGLRFINFTLFTGALLTFVLFLLSENRTKGFLKYTGLLQRLNLIILYAALVMNYVSNFYTQISI